MATGRKMSIDSFAQAVTITFIPEATRERLRDLRYSCVSESSAETSTRLGFNVVLDAVDLPTATPATSFRREAWYAPDLGCIALEERLLQINASGEESLAVSTRVENVRLGEPDPALFQVPTNYVEMSPSEFAASYLDSKGESLQSVGADPLILQLLDQSYSANQQ